MSNCNRRWKTIAKQLWELSSTFCYQHWVEVKSFEVSCFLCNGSKIDFFGRSKCEKICMCWFSV